MGDEAQQVEILKIPKASVGSFRRVLGVARTGNTLADNLNPLVLAIEGQNRKLRTTISDPKLAL